MIAFLTSIVRQLFALLAALYAVYLFGSWRGGKDFVAHIQNALASLELALKTL